MRLRQVALVARDLAPARDQLFKLLGLTEDFADPLVSEFGLCNSVVPVGDTFLELVSPIEEGTTAGRLLERRGGDGGYMVLLEVDDLSRDRARVEALGVRVVAEIEVPEAKAIHLHPRDIGGAITSFDQVTPPGSWVWGGAGWQDRTAKNCTGITAIEIQAVDPAAMSGRWAQVLGRELKLDDGQPRILLDRGEIRFLQDRNGRGDGVAAVEFSTHDIDRVMRIADELSLPRSDSRITLCGTELAFTA